MSRLTSHRCATPFRSLTLVLLAGLAVGGCADRNSIEVGSIPDDYRTRHPIVVSEDEEVLEIPVVSSEIHLPKASRDRIGTFALRYIRSGSVAIRVLLPSGSSNEAAARLASDDVVKALRKEGVRQDRILIQPYHAGGQTGPVPIRLSFATLAARTGPCGRWPEDLGDTHENRNYFNFGCASQQNLAAQIADPRDLLGPRGIDNIDAERRTKVIDDYRNGVRTGSEPERNNDVNLDF